jgi:serine/threonine-protein kinase
MFALGILSGYGSREVFVWLDAQVTRIFKVSPQTKVPDLLHKTKEEAEKILKASNLRLGQIAEEPSEDQEMIGKVVGQDPLRDASIACGGTVGITVAVKKP